ncbi:negative elongation factor E-like [Xenia sp. Carnegie-2017]|uniref:negative elongation factor E-like n=1 Tax=Xenia sp. Carnegie-2017 TaxID=2897299 RepID=UPI001F04461C|nr:negative elongation factor E-like [Xenia sp. Carnegie-2017]XP_046859256.1 negative elongation factor E-like [Xenia sp. Carnegie-2017]
MYTKNFVKSGDGGDQDNSDSKYGHKEYKYNRGYREPKKGNTIFIKGHGLTEEIVRNEFVKFGTVTDIHFEKERRFSFVTYQNVDEAEKAIEEMNGTKIVSGYIQVSFARRQYRNERGDSPMWSRGYQPRDRNEKVKEARELQSYGEDFFEDD